MTNRPNNQNGLSKKELLAIIEKMDADKNKMKNHNQKPRADNSGLNHFNVSSTIN